MSLNDVMTPLMDKARKLTGLTDKIGIARLTELMDHFDLHVNPNLINTDDFGNDHTWMNGASYKAEVDWNEFKVLSATNTAASIPLHSGINKTYAAELGKTYTFSVYAKASVEPFAASIRLTYGGAGSATMNVSNKRPIAINTEWKRYSVTFVAQKGGMINPRVESDAPGTLYLAGYKLEVGDLATPLALEK